MRQIPGKHGPDVLHKSVIKITIGSGGSQGVVHLTKKADRARIRSDLKKPGPDGRSMLIYLAIISLKRKGVYSANKTLYEKARSRQRAQGIATNWRILVRAEARRILAARLRSAGFIVAGWMHALRKLRQAANIPGKSQEPGALMFNRGSAAESYPQVSTPVILVSGLFNTSEGADVVSNNGVLQSAIDQATADNLVYLERKFGAAIRDAVNGTSTAQQVK